MVPRTAGSSWAKGSSGASRESCRRPFSVANPGRVARRASVDTNAFSTLAMRNGREGERLAGPSEKVSRAQPRHSTATSASGLRRSARKTASRTRAARDEQLSLDRLDSAWAVERGASSWLAEAGFGALEASLREHAPSASVTSESHETRSKVVASDASDGPTVVESLHASAPRARAGRQGQLDAAPGVPKAPLAPNARSETQYCAEVWSTCEKLVPRRS